ncbi:MAG: hypothetical protein KF773_00290 [Deltaproteobacteria bacterium]|nr:hypothetical protein [Deltaproteobacteria bacterium]
MSQDKERVESAGFYEMLWDCDHCDTKGLLGKSQRHCPECGAKQNPDKRYFPKEGDAIKEVVGHKYEGADRVCPACSAAIGALGKNCTNCGSPLDGSAHVKGVSEPLKPIPVKKFPWLKVILIVLAIALFIFLIWFFFLRTKTGDVTVAGHRWERVITIEKFGVFQEDCWGNNCAPSGAEDERCRMEDHGTKQVQDGEDCREERVDKKDGTFEKVKKCKPKYRSEPTQEKHCTFSIRKWKEDGEAKSSGTMDKKREWPNAPAADTKASIGARREKARAEKLILEFQGGDSCVVSEDKWTKHKDGAKLTVTMKARSEAVQCDSIP